MKLLDILIENYDLSEPQNLEDDDILILWTEINSGVEFFKVGENLEALDINVENYAKISNFFSESKERNFFDDSEITKFEEFLFSLIKFNEKNKVQMSILLNVLCLGTFVKNVNFALNFNPRNLS
jgi:hypothetical protein